MSSSPDTWFDQFQAPAPAATPAATTKGGADDWFNQFQAPSATPAATGTATATDTAEGWFDQFQQPETAPARGRKAEKPGLMSQIDSAAEALHNAYGDGNPIGLALRLGFPQEILKDAISVNPLPAIGRQIQAFSGEKLNADDAEQLRRAQAAYLSIPAAVIGSMIGGPMGGVAAESGLFGAIGAEGAMEAGPLGISMGRAGLQALAQKVAAGAAGMGAFEALHSPTRGALLHPGTPEFTKQLRDVGISTAIGGGFGAAEELLLKPLIGAVRMRGEGYESAAAKAVSGAKGGEPPTPTEPIVTPPPEGTPAPAPKPGLATEQSELFPHKDMHIADTGDVNGGAQTNDSGVPLQPKDLPNVHFGENDANKLEQGAYIHKGAYEEKLKDTFGATLGNVSVKSQESIASRIRAGVEPGAIPDYIHATVVTDNPDLDIAKLGEKGWQTVGDTKEVNLNGFHSTRVQVQIPGMPMSAEVEFMTPGMAAVSPIGKEFWDVIRLGDAISPELKAAAESGLSKTFSMAPDVATHRAAAFLRQAATEGGMPARLTKIREAAMDIADKVYRGEIAPVKLPEPKYLDPVIARLTQAIRNIVPKIGETKAMRSEEWSNRLSVARKAYEDAGGGQVGFMAFREAMKGQLPAAEFETLNLDPKDIDYLVRLAMDPMNHLTEFERGRAVDGLYKIIGAGKWSEGGLIPQLKSEIGPMRAVYGDHMVDAMLDLQGETRSNAWKQFLKVIQAPRELMAGPDLSAAGRQAILFATRPEYWKAIVPMIKAFGSEAYFEQGMNEIRSRVYYDQMVNDGGVEITGFEDPLSPREEQWGAGLADKLPLGVGDVYKASERAFHYMLNKVRADVYGHEIANAKAAGVDITDAVFQKSLGKFINVFSGRGSIGGLRDSAQLLNGLFFSPRLMMARLQTMRFAAGSVGDAAVDPYVRKLAMKTFWGTAGAVTGILAAASTIPGSRVGMDPRSADFGKFRLGNTRIDLFGGLQQPFRIVSQLLSGQVISSTSGKPMLVNNPDMFSGDQPQGVSPQRPGISRLDIIWRWFENKEAPLASFVIDMLRGTDPVGKPFNLPSEVEQRVIPLIFQDMYDAYGEWSGGKEDMASVAKGIAGAASVAPLTVFGVGTQSYGPTAPTPTFEGVRLQADHSVEREFAQQVLDAEKAATVRAMQNPGIMRLDKDKRDQKIQDIVDQYRRAVEFKWIQHNMETIREAILNGDKKATMTEAPNDLPEALTAAAGKP